MAIGISIDSSGARNRQLTVPFTALYQSKNVVFLVGIELLDGRNGSEKERVNKLGQGNQ